ncbi:MAG: replication initiation protein [Spirochaetaceae bacterium]|jgi:plasmid replication initiation protein|nr:replication initiation protein [Spirochaetaceae bacterium]
MKEAITSEQLSQLLKTSQRRKSKATVKKHDYLVRNAHFKLSAMGQKMVLYGFSLLPDLTPDFPLEKIEDRTVKFTFTDYCKALGNNPHEGKNLDDFQETLRGLLKTEVYLPDISKVNSFKAYNWFSSVGYDDELKLGYMVFTSELLSRLIEAKYFYTPLILKEIGKLKGEYAIRQYEIAKSHETEMGKYGNKEGQWTATFALSELRLLFGIEKQKYSRDRDFLKKAVINPADEINEAWFNFKIDHELIKQGKKILEVKLCYSQRTEKEISLHKCQQLLLDYEKKIKKAGERAAANA